MIFKVGTPENGYNGQIKPTVPTKKVGWNFIEHERSLRGDVLKNIKQNIPSLG
jgi:hypothetical protein